MIRGHRILLSTLKRSPSLTSSSPFYYEPLQIVSPHSAFYPITRSLATFIPFAQQQQQLSPPSKRVNNAPSKKRHHAPFSEEEKQLQNLISQKKLDQARQQLVQCHTTIDRFTTWRPLLLLARHGRQPRDLVWLQQMVEQQQMTHMVGTPPDYFDYHALMYCYGVHGQITKAEHLLSHHIKQPNVFSYNTLLACYQRAGEVDKAQRLLQQQIKEGRVDTTSYNTVLAMLDRTGNYKEAVALYEDMSLTPDLYTQNTMLHVATQSNNRHLGTNLYEQLYKSFTSTLKEQAQRRWSKSSKKKRMDIATVNAMLSFQVTVMEDVDKALDIYHQLSSSSSHAHGYGLTPDTITCNILLDGVLKQQCNPGKAAALFHQMKTKGQLVPDTTTYGIMMDAEAIMGDLQGSLALFEEAISLSSSSSSSSSSAGASTMPIVNMDRMLSSLANVAAKSEHSEPTMERLWQYLTQHDLQLDVKAYNGFMHGLAKHGRADLAQTLYDRVFRSSQCIADVATFTSLILAYINSGQVDDAMEIYYVLREHHHRQQEQQQQKRQDTNNSNGNGTGTHQPRPLQRPKVQLDTIFYTALISALTNLQSKNETSHTIMDAAMTLFIDMRQLRLQPSKHTYTAMLHWCGRCGNGEGLEEVHRLIKMDMGLDPDVGIYNALMDGYNRTDQMDQVLYLWETMITSPQGGIDATTVSIVLDACGHHGETVRGQAIWSMLQKSQRQRQQQQDEEEGTTSLVLNTNNYNSYVEFLCRVGGKRRTLPEEQRWLMAYDVVHDMLTQSKKSVMSDPSSSTCSVPPPPNEKTFQTLASFARKYGIYEKEAIRLKLDTLAQAFRERHLL